MTIIEQLARELNRPAEHIENVVRLLDEGNTIPFIARYRRALQLLVRPLGDKTSVGILEDKGDSLHLGKLAQLIFSHI